ncbi:MAG: P-loop NTPase [Nitrosomonadales bacterium]|nr:P-loop NTPase [Nitrosomonadales bacterium]
MLLDERMMDQAEGLRRMLMRASTRVITVAAAQAGLGSTSVVVNLASALARSGKDVLVLDEHLSHDNVGNALALKPRYDLLHAVRGEKTLREIMLCSAHGMRVLSMAHAMRSLPQLAAVERERLQEFLAEAARDADIVLVDAAAAGQHGISASLATDQPLLLVLNATASAITESYALIKRMALQDGRQNFEIVVNKARDAREARVIFGNMAAVARRHLRVRVDYLGYIPIDEKLKRATQLCRTVIEAFPTAPSALAFGELGSNLMLLPAIGSEEAGGLPDVIRRLMRRARAPVMVQTI